MAGEYLNSWSFISDITDKTYLKAHFYLMEQGIRNGRPYSLLGFVFYICCGGQGAIFGEPSKQIIATSTNAEDQAELNRGLRNASPSGALVDINSDTHFYYTIVDGHRERWKLFSTNLETYTYGSYYGLTFDPTYPVLKEPDTSYGVYIYHNDDGTKELDFTYTIQGDTVVEDVTYNNLSISGTIDLQDIGKIVTISRVTPIALTDEDNPRIEFSNLTPGALTSLEFEMSYYDRDTETATPIAKRTVSTASTSSYTMVLSEAEKDSLRALAFDKDSCEVRFTAYTTLLNDETVYTYHYFDEMSIVNCTPIINNLVIQEVNDDIYALTGDRDVLVKYKSMAEFSFEPVVMKGATIVETTAQNGSKVFTNQYVGVFQDVESGDFNFFVADSRGKGISTTVVKQMVEYLNPTCYVEGALELSGETAVDAHLRVYGSYFNGSFGAADNELIIEMRYTQNNGNMGDWIAVTGTPTIKDNSYELEYTVRDLVYLPSYDFQFRVKDKANASYIISSTLTKVLKPVYDWGEEDFNFNVPIYMNEKPVLRHNKDGNHTIVSASGGRMHLRPNGTDDETGEAILYPDGSISILGQTISALGDYIVESGTEAMGTNGTWYWEKWASGKAVCWGKRNFGRMSMQYELNGFYYGSDIDQSLPSGLFVDTPDYIDARWIPSNSDLGGGVKDAWLMNTNDTLPSKSTTGSFQLMHTTEFTRQETFISFHVIGRWKETA